MATDPHRQSTANWQLASDSSAVAAQISADWIDTVEQVSGLRSPKLGAQLLWSRGVRSAEILSGFLHPAQYEPASPFEFGDEMTWAVERLVKARDQAEKVAIWGDFDADGVTSTAVLWDGLRQFFPADDQLMYFIPNRLKESHGLSIAGVEAIAAQGVTLIVTCDTGSTNPEEIEHALALGIEVIVTDHHTLPTERPPVVAIVNPRSLSAGHPMADLSGVAVAYKLVEALYETLPEVPGRPLNELVDLVAIGLIADLVELRGDCRYLAQVGIQQLQTHLKTDEPTRPGVARLLQLCRRAGDRPTDISFGIGPRINAVSRIYGDASFCVELLTSTDTERCRELAEKAELANARRKALQNDVLKQVQRQLEMRDLSTMGVIVLCDRQWPVGVLGLVAGQVAQQYGKPTILLTIDAESEGHTLARGSARSVNQIDLYELVSSQAHLLKGFGGHPFAAGLSLNLDDLAMFTAAINQQYRQKQGGAPGGPSVNIDLTVTVADLGRELFQELKLLEPCGMGNPAPKLLIQNCWFEDVWHQKLKDRTGGKVGYIKASFKLCDRSCPTVEEGFPGLWWGHYKEDLPPGRWDVVAELDFNTHPKSRRYEIRLIDIRPAIAQIDSLQTDSAQIDKDAAKSNSETQINGRTRAERAAVAVSNSNRSSTAKPSAAVIRLLDARVDAQVDAQKDARAKGADVLKDETDLVVSECPTQWKELLLWQHQADRRHQPLLLAYAPPEVADPIEKWKTLIGMAKYLSREQVAVTRERLAEVLGVCDRTLTLGLEALSKAGFVVNISAIDVRVDARDSDRSNNDVNVQDELIRQRDEALSAFLAALQEEHFRRQYFYQAPLSALQGALNGEVSLANNL